MILPLDDYLKGYLSIHVKKVYHASRWTVPLNGDPDPAYKIRYGFGGVPNFLKGATEKSFLHTLTNLILCRKR